MGMDVSGRNPTTEAGSYFRNNVWWWHPLADYIAIVAPQLAAKCKYWHSNDGDGLGKRDSLALAVLLRDQVSSGRCKVYAEEYAAKLAALPRQTCEQCNGTGTRPGGLEQFGAEWVKSCNGCNGCKGTGTKEHWDSHYPFSVENVEEFSTFLEGSGGFRIN